MNKNGLNLSADIKNAEKNDVLELPYLFYPGYEITLKASEEYATLEYEESENGFVQVKMPTDIEIGEINLKYTGTLVEKISYVISAVSLIIFIIYIIYFKKKER